MSDQCERGLEDANVGLEKVSVQDRHIVVQQTSIPSRTMDLVAGLESKTVSTSGVSILKRVLS